MKYSKNNNSEKEGKGENVLESSLKVFHWKYKQDKYSGMPQRHQAQKKDSMNDFCFMYILTS